MADRKGPDQNTTPETPQAKETVAVRTGGSDPPPPAHGAPAIRPAAGSPPTRDPDANPRTARTLPRAVKPRPAPPPASNAMWVGAALLVLVVSFILLFTTHRPTP